MADEEMARYVVECRSRFQDAQIREKLLKEGFSVEEVDAAFALAATMGEAVSQAPAARRGRGRGALVALGVSAACVAVAIAGTVFVAMKVLKGGRSELPAEVRNYKPEPFGGLTLHSGFRPARLVEGNAGEDYAEALGILRREMFSGGKGAGGQEAEAQARRLFEAIERGASKRDNALVGVTWTPSGVKDFLEFPALLANFQQAASEMFYVTGKEAAESGETEKAVRKLRKYFNVGYHMHLDWDPTAQILGAGMMTQAVLAILRAQNPPEGSAERIDGAKVILEVEANFPKDLGGISERAADPAAAGGFSEYVDSDTLRHPYMPWALQSALIGLTDEEIKNGLIDRRRIEPIRRASGHRDPRVAALGRGLLQAAADLENELRLLDLEGRRDLIKRFRSIGSSMESMAGATRRKSR